MCVFEKEEVLSYMVLRLEGQLHHAAEVMEIVELCVDEKARNQGIGHLMIEYAKHLAKVKDAEILELTTKQKRKAAHRFYEREGFKNTHFKYTLDL